MRRRSCAGNTSLEHRHLLRSVRTARLHRIPSRRMRSRMLQRRRRRLFALTYLTSLTLASWTSKSLFNSSSHVYSAGSGDIFPHSAFYPSFSPMFSEVAVSISSIGKVLSLCLQLRYQLSFNVFMWESRKLRIDSGLITSLLGGEKPTVPRKVRGTLTSSILNSVHISVSPIFLCNLYSVAISEHSKSLLENYIRVIALAPDLRAVPLYSIIKFFYYGSITKLLLLLILVRGSHPSFKASLPCRIPSWAL